MLAIRMQRTGRKGHAQFRLIVQDKRFSPTSGRVVAQLGSYDPHTKAVKLDAEKAVAYLKNGAQPTDRVAMLLKKEGVKLPSWVKPAAPKKRAIKTQDKLRRNRPAGEPEPAKEEAPTPDTEVVEAAPEAEATENVAEESPAVEEVEKPSAPDAVEAVPVQADEPATEKSADSTTSVAEETPQKAAPALAEEVAVPESAEAKSEATNETTTDQPVVPEA